MRGLLRSGAEGVVALLLAALAACAAPGGGKAPTPPPPAAERGATGIAAGPGVPEVVFAAPPTGTAAGLFGGAAVGVRQSVEGGRDLDEFVAPDRPVAAWTVMGIAAAPLGALIGAVQGISRPVTGQDVSRERAILRQAVTEDDLAAGLRDRIVATAVRRGERAVRRLAAPDARPAGVDSVLTVTVNRAGLAQPDELDPRVRPLVVARVRLLRAGDGKELWTRGFTWQGLARPVPEWTQDGGKPFRDELSAGLDDIAAAVTEALFPAPTTSRRSGSSPRPAG